jgi:hypothetical protein
MELLRALRGRPRLVVASVMLLSSLAVYAPFLGSLDKVCRYWDGPPYLYVAKTFYRVPADHPFTDYNLPASYFANHLPAYPLLIRVLSLVTLGNYPLAMLLATLLTSALAAVLLYELLRRWELVASPLWTSLLFCFLPPRWLLYHAVGATEPLVFCCVFAALLALKQGRTGLVIAFTLAASLTRITGVLLVPAFVLVYLERREWGRAFAMPLALLGLLALFGWYHVVYGDFFAYFTWNLNAAGIVSLHPFEKFRDYAHGDKLHSAELFACLFAAYGFGVAALRRQRELFWYCLVFLAFCAFITHQDLPRYLLPIAPFALLVAYDGVLSQTFCRFALPLVLFVDYTYAWGYLPQKLVSGGVYEKLLDVLSR